MSNVSHFNNLITRLEDEMLFLQTHIARTPAQIPLLTKEISVSIPLRLWGVSDPSILTFAAGSQRAIITLSSPDTPNFIANFYIATSIDGLERRDVYVAKTSDVNGTQKCLVRVDGNNSDVEALSSGQPVTVQLQIAATATSVFTMSVAYEQDNWWYS